MALTLRGILSWLAGRGRPCGPPRVDPDGLRAAIETILSAYQDALGRPPDPAGLVSHLSAWLDGTPLPAIDAAIRTSPEAQARATPEASPPYARPPVRPVRVASPAILDGDTPRLWLGTTLFWLAWGVRHDRDRALAHLRWLADRGVDYVRVLASVEPNDFWRERAVTVDADLVRETTRLARDHGLRVHWVLDGGGSVDRAAVLAAFQALEDWTGVFAVEVTNEAWKNWPGSPDAFIAFCRQAATIVPAAIPFASTAIHEDWPPGPDRVSLFHFDRWTGGDGGSWRPVRQPWEAQFTENAPPPWINNEPIGPASSVASDSDPIRLQAAAVTSWICGCAAHVVHTGAGVRGLATPDRPANLWEVPGLDTSLRGIAGLRSVLPPALPLATRINASDHPHYREASPFQVDPVIEAIGRGDLLRAYTALMPGSVRWVSVWLRVRRPPPLRLTEDDRIVVYQIGRDGEARTTEILARAGQSVEVPLDPVHLTSGGAAALVIARF